MSNSNCLTNIVNRKTNISLLDVAEQKNGFT